MGGRVNTALVLLLALWCGMASAYRANRRGVNDDLEFRRRQMAHAISMVKQHGGSTSMSSYEKAKDQRKDLADLYWEGRYSRSRVMGRRSLLGVGLRGGGHTQGSLSRAIKPEVAHAMREAFAAAEEQALLAGEEGELLEDAEGLQV